MTVAEKLAAVWQARQPRERRALAVMGVVLAVMLAGQLLWSAHAGRERLRAQLPRLVAQLEALRAGAEEWRRLAAFSERPGALPDEGVRKEIAAAAQALGLAATWHDGARLELNGAAGFDAWIDWLGQTHHDYGLRVLRAKVEPAGPGRVMIKAELGPAREVGGR